MSDKPKSNGTFEVIRAFLLKGMRMSHIYQPIMIRELILNGGWSTVEQIARALLKEDRSQIDYYCQIVRQMVGRVLTKNRGLTEYRDGKYYIRDFNEISSDQAATLTDICTERVAAYLERREDPWSHREVSAGYISGTLRYEVLKRAHRGIDGAGSPPV